MALFMNFLIYTKTGFLLTSLHANEQYSDTELLLKFAVIISICKKLMVLFYVWWVQNNSQWEEGVGQGGW